MDGPLREGLEKAGFVNFGFAAGGFAVLMSNTPIDSLDDLKGKKVWIPEGDEISRRAMQALSLSPVTLPLTDVLTGLQTGLIDIVAMSPIGALVLQWHTKVRYITELPLVYTMGFMAVDKRAFGKLSAEDQAIVREVMTRTYENFDKMNLVDNRGARDALLNTGIESVQVAPAEYDKVRAALMDLNTQMADEGRVDNDLFDAMLAYIAEYRSSH